LAERGLSDVKTTQRRKTALRVLASIAMYNVSIIGDLHDPDGSP